MLNKYAKILKGWTDTNGDTPVLVHSNMLVASIFTEKCETKKQWLINHKETLEQIISPENIWIPVFNFDFPKTSFVNLKTSKSFLGPFTEYMRREWAKEQTLDPVFSIASLKPILVKEMMNDTLVAFSNQTAFSTLVDKKGGILFYGTNLISATILHYVELLSGLLYRYNKTFQGHFLDLNGDKHKVNYVYHVRPRDKVIIYDVAKIEKDLIKDGLFSSLSIEDNNLAFFINAYDLTEYCLEKMNKDSYYLLDDTTRSWVEPMIQNLGRGFVIGDFE